MNTIALPDKWTAALFDRVFKHKGKSCSLSLRSLRIRDQRIGAYQGSVDLEGVVANVPIDLKIHHFRREDGNTVGELAVHGTPDPSLSVQLYDPEGTLTAVLRQSFMGGGLVSARLTLKQPIALSAITELSREHPVVWVSIEQVHLDEFYGTGLQQPTDPVLSLHDEIAATRREAKLASGLLQYLSYGAGLALIFHIADQIAPQIEKAIGWHLRWGLLVVGFTAFSLYFDWLKRRIVGSV